MPDASRSTVPLIAGLHLRRLLDSSSDYEQMAAVYAGSREWRRSDPPSARDGLPTAERLAAPFKLEP